MPSFLILGFSLQTTFKDCGFLSGMDYDFSKTNYLPLEKKMFRIGEKHRKIWRKPVQSNVNWAQGGVDD
jgi:hypothetical protein